MPDIIINDLLNPPENVVVTQGDTCEIGTNGRYVNMPSGANTHGLIVRIDDNFVVGNQIKMSLLVSQCYPRIRIFARAVNGSVKDTVNTNLWVATGIYKGYYMQTPAKTGTDLLTWEISEDATALEIHIDPVDFTGATSSNASCAWTLNTISTATSADPYSEPGTSYPAGGDGTFDFSSTDIPIPGLPSISATSTGFCALYNPSTAGMQSLASYLWSGSFDIENYRKIMANPMDAILGCHIIPVISGHPTTVSSALYVGNISTGISMARFTEQYYSLDCGTVNVLEKWGAYLDYSPYTKLQLYLPYIGYVSLKTDDVMGGSIGVTYHVDIVSGAVCAFVYCVSKDGFGHVLYSYTGACACDVPITEGQYTNAVLGILQIAGAVGQTALSGAIGSASGVMGGIQNAANAALSMAKPEISRSGSFGGSAGLMGIQYPYLILETPRMCIPGQQNKFVGYPSFMTVQMGVLTGYNEIEVNHLNNMSCTSAEADEIINLLKSGVIF